MHDTLSVERLYADRHYTKCRYVESRGAPDLTRRYETSPTNALAYFVPAVGGGETVVSERYHLVLLLLLLRHPLALLTVVAVPTGVLTTDSKTS